MSNTATPPFFTIEAVNALVPRLRVLMEAQMERRVEIEKRLEELSGLMGRTPETIQVERDDPADVRDLKEALVQRVDAYQSGWREIEETGAVLKDPRKGLLDFYGHVDGKAVWLCWRYGEDAVAHYHELDEGFAGRKPIEATMRRRHLN